MKEYSEHLMRVMRFFTTSRIFHLMWLLLVLGIAVAFWENRPLVYNNINRNLGKVTLDQIPPEVSEVTKANIKAVVDRSPSIVAAQLVNINFRKNIKKPVFFYSDVSVFDTAMAKYEYDKVSESVLLNDDETNNIRIVKIMNGEFTCVPLPERIVRAVPISEKVATTICSISIPPYYGEIVGYANIWLDHEPKQDEIPDYRAIVRSMSVDVFERDLKGGR